MVGGEEYMHEKPCFFKIMISQYYLFRQKRRIFAKIEKIEFSPNVVSFASKSN